MYISGHKEILDEVLTMVEGFFDGIERFPNMTKKLLSKGLSYPDLPCGKYRFVDDGKHVIMSKKITCSMMNLYKIATEMYMFKEIFQSHRGVYSFLHAMSYNPKLQVHDVVKSIINHLVSYAFLAVYDDNYYAVDKGPSPNIFWMGIILHTVMDSYSQAHTMRLSRDDVFKPKEEKDKTRPSVHFMVKLHKDLFNALDKESSKVYSKEELQQVMLRKYRDDATASFFVEHRMKEIYKAYKMHMFERKVLSITGRMVDSNIKPFKTRKPYDIYNFQFYNNQPSIYHKKYDLMTKMRSYPELYARMLDECAEIMRLYKTCLRDIQENPANHLSVSTKFIKDFSTFLVQHPFRIASSDWKTKTGLMYSS
jgi:hypothetical protein